MSAIFPAAGIIGLLSVLAMGGADAATCPPVAVVNGPAEIVASVRAILRAHDTATRRGPCPDQAVRASLLTKAGSRGYILHIEDPFGRTSDRQVSDAETAASLIESWAQPVADEVSGLPARSASARPAVGDDLPARPAAAALAWQLTGALELAGSSDDSLWYGGAVTGCARIAALCIGGRLRFARDDNLVGPDRDLGRSATELLLLAALPWARGGVVLTPMVGAGVGWVHTRAAPVGDELDYPSSDDLGARVEAAASAAVTLSPHVSLVGEIGASHAWSIASYVPAGAGGTIMKVPAGFLRAAFACQYTP